MKSDINDICNRIEILKNLNINITNQVNLHIATYQNDNIWALNDFNENPHMPIRHHPLTNKSRE
jgi:hypothetical protein